MTIGLCGLITNNPRWSSVRNEWYLIRKCYVPLHIMKNVPEKRTSKNKTKYQSRQSYETTLASNKYVNQNQCEKLIIYKLKPFIILSKIRSTKLLDLSWTRWPNGITLSTQWTWLQCPQGTSWRKIFSLYIITFEDYINMYDNHTIHSFYYICAL